MRGPAERFLDRYVMDDGRVLRLDQGGDIVSEGQAYGMLIAQLAGRDALAGAIWSWTDANLRRHDGLFASRALGDGTIDDPHSATDADVLLALALLRSEGPDRAPLRGEGLHVAQAVLEHEATLLADGAPLLLAGAWAKSSGTVNPSYLMPGVFEALSHLTGDHRWITAAAAATTLIAALTDDGRRLPPDWSQLRDGGLVAVGQPGGPAGVQYGFDAARLPIWFATACSPGTRRIAAGWWRSVLSRDDRSAPQTLTLSGDTVNADAAPLPLLAGAAAATAAGEQRAASQLLVRAQDVAATWPTYYGDAWAALGPALLDRRIDLRSG